MGDNFKSFRDVVFFVLPKLIIDEELLQRESSVFGSKFFRNDGRDGFEELLIFELLVLRKGDRSFIDAVVDGFILADSFLCRLDNSFLDEGTA